VAAVAERRPVPAEGARRKRRPRPETAQKRLAILDAAARAIARRGFHGMSMRELAAETGQVLAGFYNYFASKQEVLFHIQATAFETMLASAQEAIAGLRSPSDRLFAFIYRHVRYVADHPDVMRVLVHEAGTLPARERGQVRRLKERYYDLGREIVAELYREGCGAAGGIDEDEIDALDLERMTYGIFGMLNWTYGWYRPSRHGSAGDVARSLHRVALCGLVARCPGRLQGDSTEIERRLADLRVAPLLGGSPS
jgi:AcrR family transcriptional regulator